MRCRPPRISIHALREEGDKEPDRGGQTFFEFLSTPSARRATTRASSSKYFCTYFYPRPPRGGRLWAACKTGQMAQISIHALREEGDKYGSGQYKRTRRFLSTPSARRATNQVVQTSGTTTISIHALREEGD